MRIRVSQGFEREKFKELIVLLWQLGEQDDRMGATKLNKLMWYADKAAYLRRGYTITGAKYQHLPEGPAARALKPVRDELIAEGRLRPDPRPVFDRVAQRMEVVDPADLARFAPDELADVHETVRRYWYLDNSAMSRLSHFEGGWAVTNDGDDIPEPTFWLSAAPLNDSQIEAGQRLWQRLHG